MDFTDYGSQLRFEVTLKSEVENLKFLPNYKLKFITDYVQTILFASYSRKKSRKNFLFTLIGGYSQRQKTEWAKEQKQK